MISRSGIMELLIDCINNVEQCVHTVSAVMTLFSAVAKQNAEVQEKVCLTITQPLSCLFPHQGLSPMLTLLFIFHVWTNLAIRLA
jgi:hypothetical protein